MTEIPPIVLYHPGKQEAQWAQELAQHTQCEVITWQPGVAGVVDAEVLVAWAPPQALIDAMPRLRLVFHLGAGVDALWQTALPAEAVVVRLEDAGMAEQMADYALYAVTRHTRGMAQYERDWRAGAWSPQPVKPAADWTIGVLGYGALGAWVAEVLSERGYNVHAWSRTAKTSAGIVHHSGDDGLKVMLKRCHVLVLMLPLTPETQHVLNAETLALLPHGSYVINLARGGLIDTDALIAALESGHLAGAALDVFEQEPLPAEHRLRGMPQVMGTPHIAAQTWVEEACRSIASNLQAWRDNNPLSGVVDRHRAY